MARERVPATSAADTPRLPVGGVTGAPLRPLPRRVTDPTLPRWRRITMIAWPVVLANLLQSMTLTVDLVFVGQLGAEAMAAAGLATQAYFLPVALATGIAAGATALVARAFGAGDVDGADRATMAAFVTSFAVGLPLALALAVGAGPLLALFGATDPVAGPARTFLVLLAAGLPANVLVVGLTGAFQGAGDTRPTLIVGLVVNVLNVALDYVLIFGRFGFPAMGLAGAAAATAVSFVGGAVLFIGVLRWGRRPLVLRAERPDWRRVRSLARVGFPAGAEALLLSVGFTAFLILILRFGADALAAHQIGLRVQSFAFLPGFGFSTAAGALVGQALGAGEPAEAERDGWGATRLGLVVMMAVSVPLMLLAAPIARLFTPDDEAVRLGAIWIRVLVVAMPAIAVHFTIAGALRGAGDTRWPLLVSFAGLWLVRLPLAWVLAVTLGFGMFGVWAAYTVEYYGRAVVTGLRFRGGRWKSVTL